MAVTNVGAGGMVPLPYGQGPYGVVPPAPAPVAFPDDSLGSAINRDPLWPENRYAPPTRHPQADRFLKAVQSSWPIVGLIGVAMLGGVFLLAMRGRLWGRSKTKSSSATHLNVGLTK